MPTRVIVNADDFGLCPAVNQAVALAHRTGVLSSTSLLVNAPATAEAVALAGELPELGVGLHLALTELEPLTAAPHLAPGGRFPSQHLVAQCRLWFQRVPAAELRAEVQAQFEAALRTGLPIDHVDGHGHVHLVPGVLEVVAECCREFGIRALRWSAEPPGLCAPTAARLKRWLVAQWCRRGEAQTLGLARPAWFRGLVWSGQLSLARLRQLAASLPDGTGEIMCHPAMHDEVAYAGYVGAVELAALRDPDLPDLLPPRARFSELCC